MTMLTSNIMKLGWQQMLAHKMPDGTGMFTNMPRELVAAFENSFYAGAKHVIDTLVYAADLDEGDEITAADTNKIDALMHEINEYFARLAARANPAQHMNGH